PAGVAVAPAAADERGAAPKPAPAEKASDKKGLRIRAEGDGWVAGTSDPFEAKEGATTTAPTIVLSRGATLVGSVKDVGGGAIAGARVEVVPKSDLYASRRGGRSVRSRADGTFTVDTLSVGEVVLTVVAEGYAAGKTTVDVKALDANPTVEVRLRAGLPLR